MVDIICLGNILNETIKFSNKVISQILGGPAAYSSGCLASLGVNVGIITKIGSDFPREFLKIFDEIGVDTSGLIVGKSSTKNNLIYDKEGNKIVKYLTKADNITFNDIPKLYLDAQIFYICPVDYEVDFETIKKIHKLNKIIAVDLGGYGGGTSVHNPIVKDWKEIKKMSPYCNMVKASKEDIGHIFKENISEQEAAEKIIAWGAEVVIITIGENGCYIKDKSIEKYISSYPLEKVIDQTGAGDCFFAGFLAKYLKCNDLIQSSVYGNATSSYILERSGGVTSERMPGIKEVEERSVLIKIYKSNNFKEGKI